MPEGDTLRRTAAALGARILEQTCLTTKPQSFRRLEGRSVVAVEAYGKHLFIGFDSGLSLHSHLGMRGSWHVYRAGEPIDVPARDVTVILTFERWTAVLARGALVELVADRERVSHLGPDILADDFAADHIAERALEHSDRAIGEVLLDQTVCAGIGNIYKCEVLWESRLDPWRPMAEVNTEAVSEIYRVAREKMLASVHGRRRALHAVHGRGGKPCRRCSSIVRVERQGNPPRLTYWCPQCQGRGRKAPGVPVRGPHGR